MKTSATALSLLCRLSLAAASLLLAQQATALGTDPGVTVQNQATVTYQVGGNNQAPVPSNLVEFVVDRRVDFTVTRMGTGLTTTVLGDTDGFVDFYVTNLSNGDLDFNLLFTQLVPADGDIYGAGTADTGEDMLNVRVRVSSALDPSGAPGTGPDPALGDGTFIDDLPEDRSIRVRIYANTPPVAANNAVAGLSLDATAADPASTTNLTESATWTPATVDNVFANASGADGGGNATESDRDGFLFQAAQLTIAKTQAVISDPFSSGLAIPGARIEYTITIDNSGGTAAATGISIADTVDSDVTFVTDAYNGGSSNIEFDRGAGSNSFCLADDAGDTNGDGCTWDGTALGVAGRDDSSGPIVPIDVAAGAIVTVNFVVEVPTT